MISYDLPTKSLHFFSFEGWHSCRVKELVAAASERGNTVLHFIVMSAVLLSSLGMFLTVSYEGSVLEMILFNVV